MTHMTVQHPCSHPGCTAIGVVRVEDGNWRCTPHIHERINSLCLGSTGCAEIGTTGDPNGGHISNGALLMAAYTVQRPTKYPDFPNAFLGVSRRRPRAKAAAPA